MAQENTGIACGDGIDNDGDGLIDCEDQDCASLVNDGCQTCFNDGLSFADFVIDYQNTCGAGNMFQNPEKALGVSDDAGVIGSDNFVSLGSNGWIRLGFSNNRIINSGDNQADIWIFEIGPAVEATRVELRPFDASTLSALVSAGIPDGDGDGFFDFGAVMGATSSVDIESIISGFNVGALVFDAIKLTDQAGIGCNSVAPGADIDAVCALSSVPVELCNNQIDDDGDGLVDCDDPDLAMECCCLSALDLELGDPITTCQGDTIYLTIDSNFQSYLWEDGSSNQNRIITATGNYSVTATDNINCVFIDHIQITFFSDIQITQLVKKCPEEIININGIPISQPGIYFDTIPDLIASCDTIITYQIMNHTISSDFLGPDQFVCADEYTITSPFSETSWPDGTTSAQFPINTSGQFYVSAQDSNNCQVADTISVELIRAGEFYMPNAFSPNNDGINETLRPFFPLQSNPVYLFHVYDRWGTKIFERHGRDVRWNGLHGENPAATGVYTWVLEFDIEACNTNEIHHGDVLLLR